MPPNSTLTRDVFCTRAVGGFLLAALVFLYLSVFIPPATPIYLPGDASVYLLNAQRMLEGESIYRDFFQHTLPGTELFYLALNRQLMSTEVNGKKDSFEVGPVRPLFRTRAAAPALTYDVTADGQRFLVINSVDEEQSSPLTLVVNWNAGLKP